MTPDPAVRVRAAFRELALGLMDWQDPPLMGAREYRRLEGLRPTPPGISEEAWLTLEARRIRNQRWGDRIARREELNCPPITYRPFDPQGEVEPFDVQADWEENHS